MKQLIIAIIFAFSVSALITACNGQNKAGNAQQEQQPTEDSVITTAPEVFEAVKGRIVVDTVIGRWTIKTTKDSNDIVVKLGDWAVRDSSVFLTLAYDNKIVCSGKEIRTKDITGIEDEVVMHYDCGELFYASDCAIYLTFTCIVPDTDDGYYALYQIQPDGSTNIAYIYMAMGVDYLSFVSEFMIMYLNECAAGASVADLKHLYEHYCTEELAEELSAAPNLIGSDDTDFRQANRTLFIDNLDGQHGPMLEKYSFVAKFKPNTGDESVTDSIYIEVCRPKNKISKIETDENKVALYAESKRREELIREVLTSYKPIWQYDSVRANTDSINTVYPYAPDSLIYCRQYYMDGTIAAEGWMLHDRNKEALQTDNIGTWKYYSQDGKMAEKQWTPNNTNDESGQ